MKELKHLYHRIKDRSEAFLGYPVAKDFNYQEFAPFLNLCINNVGDPEAISTFAIDTKDIEKKVTSFFTDMLHGHIDDIWGYVTNGGTEGNLYGLYLARERYHNAIVYYSESTHYSAKKNLHLLNMENIMVRSQSNGEMDYDDFESLLTMNRNRPVILFLNIGTTMKEAIDDLGIIKSILRKYTVTDYYVHCDAAFLGCIAPFVSPKPKFDFAEGIDSISISGHKFIGSPIPCGIVLVRRHHRSRILNSVSYVGTLDTTITGSRNGLTPLFLWSFIQKHGKDGLQKRVLASLELAQYTEDRLNELEVNAWRNPNALTVVFDRPSHTLCVKHQLAAQDNIAHIICMPGVHQTMIDNFIEDYKKELNSQKTKNLEAHYLEY